MFCSQEVDSSKMWICGSFFNTEASESGTIGNASQEGRKFPLCYPVYVYNHLIFDQSYPQSGEK